MTDNSEPNFGNDDDFDGDDFDVISSEFVKMDHMVPVSKEGEVSGALILVYPRDKGEKTGERGDKYPYVACDVVVLTPDVDPAMIAGPFPCIIENVHMQGIAVVDKLVNQLNRRPGRPVLQRVFGKTIKGRKIKTDRWYGFTDAISEEDRALGKNGARHYKANQNTPFDV